MVSLFLSALLIFASMCGVKPFLSKENSIDDRSQTNSAQPVKYGLQSAPSVSVEDGERTFRSSMEDFSFKKNSQITDVVASGDARLANFEISDDVIVCSLTDFPQCGQVELSFYDNGSVKSTIIIFFARDNDGNNHSSTISLDTCKRAAGQELDYTLSFERDDEMVATRMQAASAMGTIGVTGSISGYLKWKDSEGNARPLVGAKVKATVSGSWWSQTAYTNQSGYYSISYYDIWYIGSGKPSIHIYTEGDNVKVHNGGTYTKSNEFDGSSGDWTFNYTFSPADDDMGKAMMVFQGVKNFAEYAEYMNGGAPISFCNVKYPSGESEGAYYQNGTIYLSSQGKETADYPDMYAAWDVIGHEYGHHVQRHYSLADNPGGTHWIYHNAIDDQYDDEDTNYTLEQSKDRGLRLAFAEAWPTYWSTVAQTHFSSDLQEIATVGDTVYTCPNFEYNLDEYYFSFGDADEIAIQRILYKLYSSGIDAYDKFALGESALWNIILTNKPHTFYDFMQALYGNGYDKNDLGLLLGRYRIIGSYMNISNNYFDRLPTFTWSTYKGSDYFRFNQFDLYLESENGSLIKKITDISSSSSTCSYTLDGQTWRNVYNASGDKFRAYFVARQTDYFASGNYYSESFEFRKPTTFSAEKIQIKPNEWEFPGRYYFPGEISAHTEYRYSSLTKSGLTISTDRLRCGYIEDSYVNLSPRREDAGYAYLELDFNKPVYSVLYSVKMWSSSEFLDGTALLKAKDSSGNWVTIADLKNGGYLSTTLHRYYYYYPGGFLGLKFEATATATGNRNKGRISIDDLVFGMSSDTYYNNYWITNYPKTSH